MKPRRVTVPEFGLVANPTIRFQDFQDVGLKRAWEKALFDRTYERVFRGNLNRFVRDDSLYRVKEYILDTCTRFPDQLDVLREVIKTDYPQYKELADKIIMLQ